MNFNPESIESSVLFFNENTFIIVTDTLPSKKDYNDSVSEVLSMKLIKQIFVILLFYVLGEMAALGIKTLFPGVFVPGTIIGMGLLLMVLASKKMPLSAVDDVGSFLTNNMAFFFIPAAVSVLEYLDLLKNSIGKILLIIVISILFSFAMVSLSVKLTLWLQQKYGKKQEEPHA